MLTAAFEKPRVPSSRPAFNRREWDLRGTGSVADRLLASAT